MAFDIIGAKRAGYSDTEIADYLAQQTGFDASGARQAGYSDQEIIGHVSGAVDVGANTATPAKESTLDKVVRIAKDSPRMLAMGIDNVGIEAGQALDFLGAHETGRKIKGIYQVRQKETSATLDPETQRVQNTPIYDENTGEFNWSNLPEKAVLGAVQSAPDMVAALAPSTAAIAGLSKLKSAGKIAQAAQKLGASEKVAKYMGDFLSRGVAGGVTEGVQAGLGNAAQTEQKIREADISQLQTLPVFQSAYAQTDSNLPEDQRAELARDAIAHQAALDVFIKTAPTTGALGVVTGGGATGMLSEKMAAKAIGSELARESRKGVVGAIKNAAEGLGEEAIQEGAQSPSEQYIQNKAEQQYLDANTKPSAGVVNSAIEGAASGGILGLAGGGASHVAAHIEPQPVPDGPLSRAVSRASAPVQPIGSLIAERRGLAAAAPTVEPQPVEQPVEQPAVVEQPVGMPKAQPIISRAAAPAAGISDLVAASREQRTPTMPVNDGLQGADSGLSPVQQEGSQGAEEMPAVRQEDVTPQPYKKTLYRGIAERESLHSGGMGKGTYYTSDPDIADSYAKDFSDKPGKVETHEITLQKPFYAETLDDVFSVLPKEDRNPLAVRNGESIEDLGQRQQRQIQRVLASQGYDGIVLKTSLNPRTSEYVAADEVVVFPNQQGVVNDEAIQAPAPQDEGHAHEARNVQAPAVQGADAQGTADEAALQARGEMPDAQGDEGGVVANPSSVESPAVTKGGGQNGQEEGRQGLQEHAGATAPAQPAPLANADTTRAILATLAKPKKRSDASIAKLTAAHGRDAVNHLVTSGMIAFPGKGMAELTKKGREQLAKMPRPLSPLEQKQLANLAKNKNRTLAMEVKFQELAALAEKTAQQPTNAKYSMEDRPSPALDLPRVQSSFPGQQITEDNGVFTVTTPSGVPIRISTVGSIEFDRKAAELAYGREMLPGEKPVAEFRPLDHGAVINLTERGVGELDHETFHAAMSLALKQGQRAAVLKKYGTEEAAAAEYQRLKNSGAFEEKRGNIYLAKIYQFFRRIRELIAPTAKGVMQDVASGRVWAKAKGGTGGPKYALSRADQAMTAEQKAAVEAAFGTPPTMMDRAKAFKKDLRKNLEQGIFDQYAPIKELDMGAYMKARMTKGGDSTLEAVMLYGKPYIDDTGSIKVEFNSRNKGMNGFAAALAELDGEHDRFLKWVAGIRAARLKDIGLENLMSKETIAALKTLNRDGTAENKLPNGQDRAITYSRVLNHMNAYNDAILKVAVERGLINDATRQMYKDMPYIPFYRLQDEGVVAGFTATAGLVNQTAWKKLKGGTNKLNDDMLANMLKNWSHLITASARNEASAKVLTKAVELGAAHEVPAGYPGKGIVSFRENTTTVLKEMPDGTYKRVQGQPIPQGTKYKDGGVDKVSDGTVVPEFNVERHFIVTDPHLLDAITSIGQVTKVPKPIKAFKNILTHTVTMNPTFKIRNLIRDSISSIALADLSYNPAKNIKKGFALTGKHSETRAQMMAAGGIMRFGSMLDGANADNARKLIDSGVPADHILDSPNKVAAVWKKYIVGAFDAYQEFGDRSEQINRAALYQALLEKGYTADEAAFWARDLMDFSMSGKWAAVRFLTQTVPFMNARLQGLYKLGKSAKADKKRFGYVIGGVVMSSLALMAAYDGDDDWDKREAWDRDNYWWFKVGDKAFRIPKPFEIGAIGSVAEWSAELMFKKEMTGKKFAARMRDIISSQLSLNPTPQIVKPLIDLWANKDSFTQRPIEGMGMDRMKSEDRMNDRTTGTAKLLGQLGMPNPAQLIMGRYEGLSPVQIDFLIRGYFSWLGVMATTALDYGVFKPLSGVTSPAPQLKDAFLVGNFVESLPSNSSRYVSELYDQAKEVEQAYNSYRNAVKSGDKGRAKEIMASDSDKIQKHGQVNRLKEAMSDINQQIRKVTANPNYTAAEKRENIDRLKQRQDAVARKLR